MVGKTYSLPPSCPCGSKFDIQHSMSYKKGVFICIRHNDLRDQTANMMSEVSKDRETEPKLTPLCGELQDRTSNNSNKERVDIGTRGFWEQGQQAFYGLQVFDPNVVIATSPCSSTILWMNRKRDDLTMKESFTPLVFSINGSVGRECQKFYSRLAQMNLKRETFRNRFQVIGFEQRFALGC